MDESVPVFPVVEWGQERATFVPMGALLPVGNTVAALTFAWEAGQFALADIAGRGWCIPGGRLEAGETPEQAARREAWEEIGAMLGPLRLLGHCVLFAPLPASGCLQPIHAPQAPARLIAMYLGNVLNRDEIPSGSESQGVRLVCYGDLPTYYFTWDALMEAMFAYAEGMRDEE